MNLKEGKPKDALRKKCPYSEFSSTYFPAFGLNAGVQPKCVKIQTKKTPIKDTFHAVIVFKKRRVM